MRTIGRRCRELRHRLADDSGNAVVEFVGLSVVVLIPLVYLVLTLSVMQAASFAADTVARQAVRIAATETDESARQARLAALAEAVGRDYGVDLTPQAITLECDRERCTDPGALVRVNVSVSVSLPGLGAFGLDGGIVTIDASHAQFADEHIEKVR